MIGTRPTQSTRDRALPAVMSLLVPGVGHLYLGLWIRGAIWLAGWVVLVALGAGHLLPGLLLMLASGVDALAAGRAARTPSAGRHEP